MKEIIITAKTQKGIKAIEQNQRESLKLKFKEKAMFKIMGYSQDYLSDPKRAILRIKNPRYSTNDFLKIIIKEINDSLLKNGAKKKEDYTLEINTIKV